MASQALALARELDPDVILMDIRMPKLDGVEATKTPGRDRNPRAHPRPHHLRHRRVRLRSRARRRERVPAQRRRAPPSSSMPSASSPPATPIGPAATRHLVERFAHIPNTTPTPGVEQLTDRELEILRMLAEGLSNAEIADRLYLGETTIKTHVSAVLRKLGVRDQVQAVIAAYESGIVQPGG